MSINNRETVYHNVIHTFSKTIEFFDISPSEARLFSLLYLENSPMTLDEMSQALGKSKTAVSTGIRTLLELNLVKRVWKKGIRKDLYETNNDLYKRFMQTYINNWIKHAQNQHYLLKEIEKQLTFSNTSEEEAILLNKLATIIDFHQSIEKAFTMIDPKHNRL
ncbi:GbsR/MarR family transcriptional regulator [Paraliobacillus sp. JSM ZJ581]|uniref:GbsR/MarR family transcriptional regulator n=1 Tax=Paraliobacillus sp. JSM ZJ581 TaxID=3342118 RepID=UPI0035A99FD2